MTAYRLSVFVFLLSEGQTIRHCDGVQVNVQLLRAFVPWDITNFPSDLRVQTAACDEFMQTFGGEGG